MIGMLATVKDFSYNDTTAHASMNKEWSYQEKIDYPVHVIITEQFDDYECGRRYIGIIQHKPEGLVFNNDVVYFSEHDVLKLVNVEDTESLNAMETYCEYLKNKIKEAKKLPNLGTNWEEVYKDKLMKCIVNMSKIGVEND